MAQSQADLRSFVFPSRALCVVILQKHEFIPLVLCILKCSRSWLADLMFSLGRWFTYVDSIVNIVNVRRSINIYCYLWCAYIGFLFVFSFLLRLSIWICTVTPSTIFTIANFINDGLGGQRWRQSRWWCWNYKAIFTKTIKFSWLQFQQNSQGNFWTVFCIYW